MVFQLLRKIVKRKEGKTRRRELTAEEAGHPTAGMRGRMFHEKKTMDFLF